MAEESQMNQGPAVPSQRGAEQDRAQHTGRRTGGQQSVHRSGRRFQTTGNARPAKGIKGGEALSEARERLRTLKQDTDDYVRKNPTKAVLAALGIGFVLGLVRRR